MGSEEKPVAWLRETIEGDKVRAEGMAVLLGAEWSTRRNDSDGFDYTVYGTDPDEPVADTWRADVASWLADNAPQDTIARCEAELAILDEHYILYEGDRNPKYEQYSIMPPPFPPEDCGCVTCHYGSRGGVGGYGICRTVRLLAGGYKHRPGFPAAFAMDTR